MKKPPRLVAVCIIGMVLATIFVCVDLYSLAGQVVGIWMQRQPGMQAMMQEPGGMGAIYDFQRQIAPVQMGLASLDLLIAFALIAGAAMTLALNRTGRGIFAVTLVAACVWDTVHVLTNAFIAWKSQQLMTGAVHRMMQDAGPMPSGGGPDPGQLMSTYMGGWVAVTIGCTAAWLAIKLGYYISTLIYLRKPEVTTLFAAIDPHAAARSDGMIRG